MNTNALVTGRIPNRFLTGINSNVQQQFDTINTDISSIVVDIDAINTDISNIVIDVDTLTTTVNELDTNVVLSTSNVNVGGLVKTEFLDPLEILLDISGNEFGTVNFDVPISLKKTFTNTQGYSDKNCNFHDKYNGAYFQAYYVDASGNDVSIGSGSCVSSVSTPMDFYVKTNANINGGEYEIYVCNVSGSFKIQGRPPASQGETDQLRVKIWIYPHNDKLYLYGAGFEATLTDNITTYFLNTDISGTTNFVASQPSNLIQSENWIFDNVTVGARDLGYFYLNGHRGSCTITMNISRNIIMTSAASITSYGGADDLYLDSKVNEFEISLYSVDASNNETLLDNMLWNNFTFLGDYFTPHIVANVTYNDWRYNVYDIDYKFDFGEPIIINGSGDEFVYDRVGDGNPAFTVSIPHGTYSPSHLVDYIVANSNLTSGVVDGVVTLTYSGITWKIKDETSQNIKQGLGMALSGDIDSFVDVIVSDRDIYRSINSATKYRINIDRLNGLTEDGPVYYNGQQVHVTNNSVHHVAASYIHDPPFIIENSHTALIPTEFSNGSVVDGGFIGMTCTTVNNGYEMEGDTDITKLDNVMVNDFECQNATINNLNINGTNIGTVVDNLNNHGFSSITATNASDYTFNIGYNGVVFPPQYANIECTGKESDPYFPIDNSGNDDCLIRIVKTAGYSDMLDGSVINFLILDKAKLVFFKFPDYDVKTDGSIIVADEAFVLTGTHVKFMFHSGVWYVMNGTLLVISGNDYVKDSVGKSNYIPSLPGVVTDPWWNPAPIMDPSYWFETRFL